MKNRQSISERVKELQRQLDNRPSNCRHCKLKLNDGNAEYICEKTEKHTLFGIKSDKCYGDCELREKDFPEMYRDMIFEIIKTKIKNRDIKPQPPELTADNLQSWMNGYSQCEKDILKIIGGLQEN